MNLETLRPLSDRLVIKRLASQPITTLEVPQIAQERSHRGLVTAVGPGRYMETDGHGWVRPCAVKVGDVVHYQSSDIDTGEHVLIAEGDILFTEHA